MPRDAASWVGRRKIYPHTATHTPVHVRHRQPDVSPAQLRLLHPPFVSKQLDAHYGKNHPSRGSFRDDDDDESAAQGLRDREETERERAGYYHVDEYLREISASRSTRPRLKLGRGILDVSRLRRIVCWTEICYKY